ncbi:MAG: autotransporter-associated beta strand repeat-containing protein, partial [Verrucomicrobia bacterium]|nr:autotransporter-associated beta strand repeat-containing protein [Verrucomicrobiota bacterium]
TKAGTGTLILGNAANAFSGTTTVNAGLLQLSVSNALSASSALSIGAAGAVDLGWGHNATVASLAGSGALDIKNGVLTVGNASNTTFSGAITDSGGYGGILKQGTGTLTLSGANTFSGALNVTAGAVNLQNSSALGGSTYGNTVSSGGALQFQNNITVNEGGVNIDGSGVGSTGALRNISGTNTFTGSVTLAGSASIGADAGSFTASGDVSLGASQTLTLVGAGDLNFSGAVYGSGSGITQTGTGTTTFSGSSANSFGGALNINSGTVQFDKAAGTAATNGGAITIGDGSGAANSANLTLLASNQIPDYSAVLTINSDGRFNLNNQSETLNLIAGTGNLNLGASGQLSIGVNGGSSVFGGSITGTGTLEKLGAGSLTFNSSINFAGTLLLSGGTLALNGFNLTVGTLHITGNTILDFGNSAASLLNTTTFIIDAGVTLTINNWVNGVDYFYAQSWTGATANTTGSTPMNQVTFNGYASNSTRWQSYDNQVTPLTPVPEPSTYGALLVAFAATLACWRRYLSSAGAAWAHPEIDDALARLAERLAAAPGDASLYLERGELYAKHEDWAQAEANYLRAAELSPQLPRLDLARGALALATGHPAEARAHLDRALTATPDDPETRILRARTLARLGLHPAALADYAAAFAHLASPRPELFLERADLFASPADALRSLEEAIALLGPVITLHLRALDLEISLGRTDAALARLDSLAANTGRPEGWLKRRGDLLTAAGRAPEARAAYAAARAAVARLPAWLAESPDTARLSAELTRLADTTR